MQGRSVLPPWPVVPPRLWATLAAGGLVILNLAFEPEIWHQHPQAGHWCWLLLWALLLAAGVQSIPVLWRWPDAYRGPAWLRPFFSLASILLCIGIGLSLLPMTFFFLLMLR